MNFTLTLIALLASHQTIPVETIVARQATPIAPRGGVLMVQLFTQEQGDNWPTTLDVTFENGEVTTGVLGWIEKNTNKSTWSLNPSCIRPITSTDNTLGIDPKDVNTGPVLLVELPIDGDGLIRFGGDAIDPQWIDLPAKLPNLHITPITETRTLSALEQDDMPEWNALEYWRWTLVAARLGVLPPDPPDVSIVQRFAALQSAQLWRIGFDRLARSSRGVAAACRDLLTNTATDDTHGYACWVVQPEPLHQLLSTLLDESANSRQLARRALRWVEDQNLYFLWLDDVFGSHVSVVIANPTLEDAVAAIKWQSLDDIPLAEIIPAQQTTRLTVERLPTLDLSIFGPMTSESQMQLLSISIGRQVSTFPIVSSEVVAMPPSVQLQALHPLWTLRSMQVGRPGKVLDSRRTLVQVRKILGKWEIFVQCGGNTEGTLLPESTSKLADLRGIEAISILHPPTNEVITVSPQGDHQGSPHDLEVHTSIDKHHWSVRFVLPDSWVADEKLTFSVVRTHGDSMQVETGPLPCVPWAIHPAPIHIDLSQWDKILSFPTQLQIR